MDEFFQIAKIVSSYGTKGFVKIVLQSDFPERFLQLKEVFIDFFGQKKLFLIEDLKKIGNDFAIKFNKFDSIDDVDILIGKEIYLKEEEMIQTEKFVFYIHDLIGSEVYRNGKLFGKIIDVMSLPSNDVYVIEKENGKEILIPALKELILSFDKKEKVLILKPGESLYEDDEN
ncbi:MAG: ribosome maturation factor RimM [Ignavibacterium sp.]